MILTRENIKSIDVDFVINQKLSEGRIQEVLFVIPTNRKARNLKKELVSLAPNSSAYQIKIETLNTLSSKMLSVSKPFHQISEAASKVFIKQISKQCKFRYLSQYRDEIPHGTLDKISNVISEYKRHGIKPETLRIEAEKLEFTEKNKALDIADIFEEYREKCKRLNAFDAGDVYEELNDLGDEVYLTNAKSLFKNVEFIFVDGFSEFSRPEVEIIKKLSKLGKLFISFDYNADNSFLFAHVEKCFANLSRDGFKEIIDLRATDELSIQSLLRENLFKPTGNKRKDLSKRIWKILGYNKENEAELIAKQIKMILLNENVEPDKICVAFNLVQEYSSVIQDVFEKVGIPFNLTDRTPLQNSGPVTALVNFLEIAENDYYFKNIFRALNSGFISIGKIDTANLYRVAAELKIVSGKNNWKNKINDALSNQKNQGDNGYPSLQSNSLEKALTDLEEISFLLKGFEKHLSIDEFQEKIAEFIIDINLPGKLLECGSDKEIYVRAIKEFLDTIKEILDLQKEEFGTDEKFPLLFFMEQIRTACGWARFNVKEKSNYGVLVTSLEEIRGLKFDYLFLGGMCDGLLPTRFNAEIFSSGTFKKQANAHQSEERFLFYRALCSWRKKLFLSYHTSENGRETIQSNFIKDFDKLIIAGSLSENDFVVNIFSGEELQIQFTQSGNKDLAKNLDAFTRANIERSSVVEDLRLKDPFGNSAFSGGLIAGNDLSIRPDELEEIEAKLSAFNKKQYSISQLEMYAKCPYKFFAERVLGIETYEEPTEDIEAVEMGRLLHSILYEFYTTLRKEKIVLQQCDDSDFQKAKKIIFEIAAKHLHNTAFKSPLNFYEREKILGLGGNENESILFHFIENERRGENDFIPKYFEVGFGKLKNDEADDELSTVEAIMVDNIKLRGKIDRIEINEKTFSFNVVDYKLSGSKPTFNDLKKGVSLQLPLYLYAAAELLSKKLNREFSPGEMFIYSLKYNADDFGKDRLSLGSKKETKFNSVNELIANTVTAIKNYVASISEGKFNLSKLEDREAKVCRFCQFRLVCRIDDIPS
jgi:ATP-dependent helicase/nuclease subunit B